ncbi:hypothetical protein K3723_07595 [Leisingera caerulea]|uniref:hypothetical protein n=1 Tax=Leisingera caerulea TaxID=506591 RepID=UPI0021A7297A|nr:hypothetical protein [Leisingera caerulea]UWQ64144.1 hypothetical protein K3723_07595 [Leisingera caerulea]
MPDPKAFINQLDLSAARRRQPEVHNSDLEKVSFRGEVVERTGEVITVDCGGKEYDLKIADIISIEEDVSSPSPDQKIGVPVLVTVSAAAQIVERRANVVSALVAQAGLRPLVYAIPSASADYSVPESRVIAACTHATLGYCTQTTPTPTPQATGNTIDYRNDFFTDNNVDQQCDG